MNGLIPCCNYDESYDLYVSSYLLKTLYFDILFDTGSKDTFDELLIQLSDITQVKRIKYIILHHVEECHIGGLNEFIKYNQNITVLLNQLSYDYLILMGYKNFKYTIVHDQDILHLAGYKISFINAQNLIWPNTMMSYIHELKTLCCGDAFGNKMHKKMIWGELDNVNNDFKGIKYYMSEYFSYRKKDLARMLKKIDCYDIHVLAPTHGPMIQNEIQKVIDLANVFIHEELLDNLIVIAYVSKSGSTKNLADIIYSYLKEKKMNVVLYDILQSNGQMKIDIKRCKAILFGTPTIYHDASIKIYEVMLMLNQKRYGQKLISAFGSYGWSGEGVSQVLNHARVQHMLVEDEGYRTLFLFDEKNIDSLHHYLDMYIKNYNEQLQTEKDIILN